MHKLLNLYHLGSYMSTCTTSAVVALWLGISCLIPLSLRSHILPRKVVRSSTPAHTAAEVLTTMWCMRRSVCLGPCPTGPPAVATMKMGPLSLSPMHWCFGTRPPTVQPRSRLCFHDERCTARLKRYAACPTASAPPGRLQNQLLGSLFICLPNDLSNK